MHRFPEISPSQAAAPPLDARAWLVWVTVSATAVIVAQNPLYTLIVLLAALLARQNEGPGTGLNLPLVRLGSIILLFSTFFNLAWIRIGESVLWRLPAGWPLVGGPWTVEAAVFGLANGLLLFTLLVVFQSFGSNVGSGDLVRLMPGALRDLGVVLLIALTYVPETGRQLRRIQQAQAIRGHRLQGWRDWQPIVIPLLIGGLERAMAVAESMVARGYGATVNSRQRFPVQIGLLVGLTAVCGGWLVILWQQWWGWLLLCGGALWIAALVWQLGRRTPRTRYLQHPWRAADSLVVGTAVLVLLVIMLPFPGANTLTYTPFPVLGAPPFHPLTGGVLTFLALPGLFRGK